MYLRNLISAYLFAGPFSRGGEKKWRSEGVFVKKIPRDIFAFEREGKGVNSFFIKQTLQI